MKSSLSSSIFSFGPAYRILLLCGLAAGGSHDLLAGQAFASDVVALDKFTVVATQPVSPVDSTALKLPTPLHETPRSVTIIDYDRIRDQDFQTLESTFRYVPGVFSNADNNDSYHFFARGFDMGPDDTKLDGFTGYLVGGSFTPGLFGIEQIVYLRGPAGLLYGASSLPGGMINLISKKPRPTTFTRLNVRYATYAGMGAGFGAHASEEATLDTNQLLTSDGRVLSRFTAEVDNRGFYNASILDSERDALFALTWKFGRDDRFALTPVFEYERQPFAAGRGLVISPSTSPSTADGRSGPINTADLTPATNNLSAGYRRLTRHIAGFDFAAALASQWHATLSYRFMGIDSDVNQFTPQAATLQQLNPADPHSWVISRRQAKSQTDRRNHAFDLETTYETLPAVGVKNLTQLGFNGRFYQLSASRSAATQPNQSPINIYTGVPLSPLVDANPPLTNAFLNHDFYWNAYAQNQTSFADCWIFTLGIGYGEQHFGRVYPSTLAPPRNLARLVGTARGEVTPNFGVVYNLTKSLALYASYATSYQPASTSSEDINGQTGNFAPTTGRNYEAGIKVDRPGGHASLTLSAFATDVKNVLIQSASNQLNPNGNQYFTQPGAGRRTRGAELSGELRPLAGWRVYLTASYLDSHYYGAGTLRGSRTEKTPPLAFSAYSRYDIARGPFTGFGIGLGAIWQNERLSAAQTPGAPDPLMLPAYTRIDAGLFYRTGSHWDFAINCENLFNRLYFVTGSTGTSLEIGAPRSLSFRAGYHF